MRFWFYIFIFIWFFSGIYSPILADETNPNYTIKKQTIIRKMRHTQVYIAYPEVGNLATQTQINKQIQEFVDSFLKSAIESEQAHSDMPETEVTKHVEALYGKNRYALSYSIRQKTKKLLSIFYHISTYGSGAMHPIDGAKTQNFDLKTGQTLTLSDIFKPDFPYLDYLSDYCFNELKPEKFKTVDFTLGVKPKAENYQNWNLEPDGLTIIFPPYQAGSYAQGFRKVTIPYATLSEFLRTEIQPLLNYNKTSSKNAP